MFTAEFNKFSRLAQVNRMSLNRAMDDEPVKMASAFYCNILYTLGVLSARLQGFRWESLQTKYRFSSPDPVRPLLEMVSLQSSSTMDLTVLGNIMEDLTYYWNKLNLLINSLWRYFLWNVFQTNNFQVFHTTDQLISDCLLGTKPSTNAILVTNNLFPFNCVCLPPAILFQQFDVQIVSEETAMAIQNEISDIKRGHRPAASISSFPSAALLAMKPTSGVKRNNAVANAGGDFLA